MDNTHSLALALATLLDYVRQNRDLLDTGPLADQRETVCQIGAVALMNAGANIDQHPSWFTVREAAGLLADLGLRVSRKRVQQLCKDGTLDSIDVPVLRRERRIDPASLRDLADRGLPRAKPAAMRARITS